MGLRKTVLCGNVNTLHCCSHRSSVCTCHVLVGVENKQERIEAEQAFFSNRSVRGILFSAHLCCVLTILHPGIYSFNTPFQLTTQCTGSTVSRYGAVIIHCLLPYNTSSEEVAQAPESKS